jgi:hypothetical protein
MKILFRLKDALFVITTIVLAVVVGIAALPVWVVTGRNYFSMYMNWATEKWDEL